MKALPAAALLAGMAFAGPAHAQAYPWKMTYICNNSFADFCVYGGNTLLGILQDENLLKREINGVLYRAGYGPNGLTIDLALFYALPSCTGPAMLQSGYIAADGVSVVAEVAPKWARFDGRNFWAASGPAELATPQCNICYGVVCNGNPEGVPMPFQASIAPYWPAYAPAAVIETPTLVVPTAAQQAAQNFVTVK